MQALYPGPHTAPLGVDGLRIPGISVHAGKFHEIVTCHVNQYRHGMDIQDYHTRHS